jgi:hypothetical protein
MRLIGVGILLISSAALFGQRGPTYGSLGGYGNVLYPGTGHAPNSAVNTFPAQLGATVAGRPFGGVPFNAPRYAHPGHSRSVIVPYPVFIGGGYYGGYAPDAYAAPPPQQEEPMYWNPNAAPSVVINQTFVPDRAYPVVREYSPDTERPGESSTMKLYPSPQTNPYAEAQPQQAPVRRPAAEAQATIYLLAFKDHNIVPALGYWMEGNTLHYVSVDHSMNQVSLDLIDRDLSQRLNDERNVEFKLPKVQ